MFIFAFIYHHWGSDRTVASRAKCRLFWVKTPLINTRGFLPTNVKIYSRMFKGLLRIKEFMNIDRAATDSLSQNVAAARKVFFHSSGKTLTWHCFNIIISIVLRLRRVANHLTFRTIWHSGLEELLHDLSRSPGRRKTISRPTRSFWSFKILHY